MSVGDQLIPAAAICAAATMLVGGLSNSSSCWCCCGGGGGGSGGSCAHSAHKQQATAEPVALPAGSGTVTAAAAAATAAELLGPHESSTQVHYRYGSRRRRPCGGPNGDLHLIMHKPACCLCSSVDGQPTATRGTKLKQQHALSAADSSVAADGVKDSQGPRQTVLDVLRANNVAAGSTAAVGRLDFESSGLMLFTSDGVLNRAVRAKEARCEKVYEVHVAGRWDQCSKAIERLRQPLWFPADGTDLPGHGTMKSGVLSMPARVQVVGQRALDGRELASDPWPWPPHAGWATVLRVTLSEGRNRQIRRLCARSKCVIICVGTHAPAFFLFCVTADMSAVN
jgi:pseudouridine synthase